MTMETTATGDRSRIGPMLGLPCSNQVVEERPAFLFARAIELIYHPAPQLRRV